MGTKPSDDRVTDFVSDVEADLLALEQTDYAAVPPAAIDEADIERAGFAPATAENLSHLAPGCFVLILTDGVYCWSEVMSVEDQIIGGRLHNELSSTTCLVHNHTAETVFFHRDQIRALGCERYCWC